MFWYFLCSLLSITSVNICHKVTHKYREVIEERWWLISMDVIDTDEAAEDGMVDYSDAALDEEYVYFRECQLKAQMQLNKNKNCGLGAEGSKFHFCFDIYVENCLFYYTGIQSASVLRTKQPL